MAEDIHSCCDDEDLAAFLDGQLGARERSRIMTHLAEADDAYEVFACTALMMAEGDALLERMQTAEVRAATRRAFDASPDDLRRAAMKAARSSEG
jgi:anti-sigma factor RsiW